MGVIHGESKHDTPFTREVPNKDPQAPVVHHPPSVRDLLHSYMAATAGNPFGWTYNEVRPLPLPTLLAHGVRADCSFGVKILCQWAGAPDATGENYDDWGNSVSMFNHLPHITLAQAQTGDVIVFGPSGQWHAVMIFTPGADPMLWSHGHPGAPNLYPLSADTRRPITVLRTVQ